MADCIIGIPTFGEFSVQFGMSLTQIAMPINFTTQYQIIIGKQIDEARNEIVEYCLSDPGKPRFLFFIDDDVIMPPDTMRKFVMKMEHLPSSVGAISGVYFSKGSPKEPLVFTEQGRGPYWDWKIGDFFPVWAAGCGLVLIRVQALRDMVEQQGKPLFAVDYGLRVNERGIGEARSITEDLYFYTKMGKTKAPDGKDYQLWMDTSVQAQHYNKVDKKFYGLTQEMPQNQRVPVDGSEALELLYIGFGGRQEHYDGCKVTTTDALKEFNADYTCPPDFLPLPDNIFDIVYSSGLLHTFPNADCQRVLVEWGRVLKPGGKIWIKVPDVEVGAKLIEEDLAKAFSIIYNAKAGFTKKLVRAELENAGFRDIFCHTNGAELNAYATKGEK